MYTIGIDLGGTNIVAGLVNDNNQLIAKVSTPTLRERETSEIIGDIARITNELLKKHDLTIKDINSLGIGSPGSCDDKNGVVVYSNNLRFDNLEIRKELQKYFDIDVRLANDADAAALGEYYAGAGEQANPFIAITLGTGVGSGIVLDGKLLTGKHFAAAELGHMSISSNGEKCTCGKKGCFEAYCSASAIIREINKAVKSNKETILKNTVHNDFSHTNAKMVFEAAEKGDVVAKEIVSTYYDRLAEGIGNIVCIFDPEVIAIGGGISAQGDKLLAEIDKRLADYVYGGKVRVKVKIANLGNDAGVIGAALIGKTK